MEKGSMDKTSGKRK